jgi:hypothetical protein
MKIYAMPVGTDMAKIDEEARALGRAQELSIAGVHCFDDAAVVARLACYNEGDAFIRFVAQQLWHRAHAARAKRENEKNDAADFPDPGRMEGGCSTMVDIFGPSSAYPPAVSRNAIPIGFALDPATYAWVQTHRTLVAALMAGEAVVVPK